MVFLVWSYSLSCYQCATYWNKNGYCILAIIMLLAEIRVITVQKLISVIHIKLCIMHGLVLLDIIFMWWCSWSLMLSNSPSKFAIKFTILLLLSLWSLFLAPCGMPIVSHSLLCVLLSEISFELFFYFFFFSSPFVLFCFYVNIFRLFT